MLSPACASSSSLRNISIPVTTVFLVSSLTPRISTSSFRCRIPRSTLPVATVPRPVIVNTSSTGIRNGLSVSRSGSGIQLSTASISSMILSPHSPLGSSRAFRAEPWIIGVSSPGNSYSVSSSRISISTSSSSSSSSTISHLFMNTTM
ncbi:unknown [Firmicutes bacterium CAG:646]|nr:unknown [Firmicutes bacterium CAG:646]